MLGGGSILREPVTAHEVDLVDDLLRDLTGVEYEQHFLLVVEVEEHACP